MVAVVDVLALVVGVVVVVVVMSDLQLNEWEKRPGARTLGSGCRESYVMQAPRRLLKKR